MEQTGTGYKKLHKCDYLTFGSQHPIHAHATFQMLDAELKYLTT